MVFSVTTAAKNGPALALYHGLGFSEYRRGTLGPEAIEMVKLRTTRSNPSVEARPNGKPPGPRGSPGYHPSRGPGALPSAPPHLER
jgi:hypothetical protein